MVFSIAINGYDLIYSYCIESHKAYAAKHGFEYLTIQGLVGVPAADAAWLKLALIAEMLRAGYDWVLFLDADCEVRTACVDFRSVVEDGKDLYFALGFSGRINSGVIFARRTEGVLRLIEHIIANGDSPVPKEDRAPYENGHVIHFAKSVPFVKIIDSQWNNNRGPRPNDYIRHYTGPMRELAGRSKVRRKVLKLTALWQNRFMQVLSRRSTLEATLRQRMGSLVRVIDAKYKCSRLL